MNSKNNGNYHCRIFGGKLGSIAQKKHISSPIFSDSCGGTFVPMFGGGTVDSFYAFAFRRYNKIRIKMHNR
jgi:hypothetical protein